MDREDTINVVLGKKYQGKKCVYCCSAMSATEDHIFARELFLVENRSNLPKAPACKQCNGRKSKLEHYLISILPFGGQHSTAIDGVMETVTRRFPKNKKLSREFFNTLRPVWVQEGSGLLLPTMSFKFDSVKLAALLKMIVRGLSWHHWSTMVEPDYYADVLFMPDMVTLDFQDRIQGWNAERRVSADLGNGTIRYEGVQTKDPQELTVWGFSVFGGIAVGNDRSRDGGPIQSSSHWWVVTAPPEVGKKFHGPVFFDDDDQRSPLA